MVARSARSRTLARDRDENGTAVKGRSGRIGKRSADPSGPAVSQTARRAILKHTGASDVSMKDVRGARPPTGPRGRLVELKVTGWEKSKASGGEDGGTGALIKWLEKKASTKLSSKTKACRIRKSTVDGNTLIIKVPGEDAGAYLRTDGWVWAGISIRVQRVDTTTATPEEAAQKDQVANMLKNVLERRYNQEQKLLDLSGLLQDPQLLSAKVFDTRSTTNKFFKAMMVVLGSSFESSADKNAAITSVSLANNALIDLSQVSDLSHTLPKLQNLDLSNNNFEKLGSLSLWRRRFYHLKHIILAGNPLETNEPEFHKELLKWYPNLQHIDQTQVRTEEDIAKQKKFRFPTRSPVFNDQGDICQTFVRNLVAGFDNDREGLANFYYDDKSQFSYSVNISGLRDKTAETTQEKADWEKYIRGSRNLTKINHLPARESRLARGTKAIAEAFVALPKTQHPDLDADANKYSIEATLQPNCPDLTGASPGGVDGFLVTIHGEYQEVETNKKRSFDRTIILGPGGQSGVRVVSDLLTIRAYGGAQAYDPSKYAANKAASPQIAAQPGTDGVPQLPPGVTVQAAEAMVAALSNQTNLNFDMAKDCLENSNWNMETAVALFGQVGPNLPPSAFKQQPAQ